MSGTPTTYPVRVVSIEDRAYFTQLKLQKPQYTPFIPAIQSTMNKYIVPYAFLAKGYVDGFVDIFLIQRYTNLVQPKINDVVSQFGVSFEVSADAIADPGTGARRGLRLSMAAAKGGTSVAHDADLVGQGPDFSPLYGESKDLAKARWEAYTRILTEPDVRMILNLAALGYELFMTEGTPTPRQQLAAVKHRMKLAAVDANYYLNAIREALDEYEAGYTAGVQKYSHISRWVMEGIRAATKATFVVLQVL
jgi:hypothetical protein